MFHFQLIIEDFPQQSKRDFPPKYEVKTYTAKMEINSVVSWRFYFFRMFG